MHQHNQQILTVAEYIHNQLFQRKPFITDPAGNRYAVKTMAAGAVQGVDIGQYRFITQNPNKNSKYAAAARQGAHISWVIRRPSSWVARVEDGKAVAL